MPLELATPVQFLRGVGPRRAEAFARLGVRTVEDLLYHTPHRYLDATSVTPIARVVVGEEVTVVGRVVSKGVLPTRGRLRIFRAILRDDTGVIECAWPGQAFLDRTIVPGQLLLVTGPVKYYHGRQIVPREQIVLEDSTGATGTTGTTGATGATGTDEETGIASGLVIPVYPATEGLSHRLVRRIMHDNLDNMLATVEDVVPPATRAAAGVLPLREALQRLHRPAPVAPWEDGRRRLAFDELLDLQLVVARARHLATHAPRAARLESRKELTSALKDALPFALTAGQK